jgi:hypothetical protein
MQSGQFGTVKLEVGRFLSALLRTNNPSVVQGFLQLGILPLCLVRSPPSACLREVRNVAFTCVGR